jgi:hypothetical protein
MEQSQVGALKQMYPTYFYAGRAQFGAGELVEFQDTTPLLLFSKREGSNS